MASPVPSINLLKRTKRVHDQKSRKKRRVISLSTIAIVIYLIILLPVVAYRIYLGIALDNISQEIDEKTQSISTQQSKEQKYILLANKLDIISQSLSNRIVFHEKLTEMFNLFPADGSIQSVNLDKKNNQLTVSGIVSDVFSMSQLYQSLKGALDDGRYKQIVLTTLVKEAEGSYLVSAQLTNNE